VLSKRPTNVFRGSEDAAVHMRVYLSAVKALWVGRTGPNDGSVHVATFLLACDIYACEECDTREKSACAFHTCEVGISHDDRLHTAAGV
jgi:hypothetical protein